MDGLLKFQNSWLKPVNKRFSMSMLKWEKSYLLFHRALGEWQGVINI